MFRTRSALCVITPLSHGVHKKRSIAENTAQHPAAASRGKYVKTPHHYTPGAPCFSAYNSIPQIRLRIFEKEFQSNSLSGYHNLDTQQSVDSDVCDGGTRVEGKGPSSEILRGQLSCTHFVHTAI